MARSVGRRWESKFARPVKNNGAGRLAGALGVHSPRGWAKKLLASVTLG
jgi:hypothetical protein